MSDEESGADLYRQEISGLPKDELERRLAKFGVKPLPKAQAIAFLQYVHTFKGKKSSGKKSATKARRTSAKKTPKKSPKGKKGRTTGKKAKRVLPDDQSTANAPSTSAEISTLSPAMPEEKTTKQKKKSKRDGYKVKLFDSSSEDEYAENETTVNKQDLTDVPMEEIDEATENPPKSAVAVRRLKTAEEIESFMMQYINDHPALHESILQYETFYLKPFLKQLKEEGVIPKTDFLMDFLDAKTICFSQHNAEKPRQWGGNKDKKRRKS